MLRVSLFLLFLFLILVRPFISSLAAVEADTVYSWSLIVISVAFIKVNTPVPSVLRLRKTLFLPLSLLFSAIALSNLFSLNPERSLLELRKFLLAASVFCAAFTLQKKQRTFLLFTLLLGATLVSLQAIAWVFFGAKIFVKHLAAQNIAYDFAFEFVGRQRAFIPFILPATLGGYLIMLLPVCVSAFIYYYKDEDSPLLKRPLGNIVLMLPVLLCFAALLLTKSVGPLLSLLCGCAIYALRKQSAYKTSAVVRILLFLAAVLILIFITRSYHVGYWRNPVFSWGQRQAYWLKTWLVIRHHPFAGVGLGNLPFVGSKFSHNSYLQIWAEMGIAGFIALLWLVFGAIKLFLLPPPDPEQKILHAGFCIAAFAFILHNLVDFTFFLPEVAIFWWIIVGFAARAERGIAAKT